MARDKIQLAVLKQIGQKRLIPIDRAVIVVGRSADCDVLITTSQKISRKHCCLVQSDSSYYVRDLGSMNGVWLNGERVNRESEMKAGDRLCIGDVEFQLYTDVKVESRKQLRTNGVTAEDLAIQESTSSSSMEALPDDGEPDKKSPDPDVEYELLDDVVPLDGHCALKSETNELKSSDAEIIDEPPQN